METTRLSSKRIQLAQKLSRCDFKIDYCPDTKNLANAFSRPLTYKDAEKMLVKQNRKILNKLQHSLSQSKHFLLHANCRAVTQPTICDE